MDLFQQLLEAGNEVKTDNKSMKFYMESFNQIIKEVGPEDIYEAIQQYNDYLFFLLPLFSGSLFVNRRYTEIHELLNGIDLSGSDISLDYFNSKLIKYYYNSLKHLGKDATEMYKLMVINSERENKYSVETLRNCILDLEINNNIYREVNDTVCGTNEEGALHAFFLGYVCLVRGEYEKSRSYLSHSSVLCRNGPLDLKIKKCMIVCKLLTSDYAIDYPFIVALQPYFSLIGAVKRGDVNLFNTILEQNMDEFFEMNLYFVIKRCIKNLLLEGLRKISVCYSRISVNDIGELLGMRVDYLLYTAIQGGVVKGRVEDEIFYAGSTMSSSVDMGEMIRETINLRKTICGMMQYPEIPVLTYEYVVEVENASD